MQHQRGGIRIERGWDAGKLTEEGFKIFGEEELQLNEVCVWLIWIVFELKCVFGLGPQVGVYCGLSFRLPMLLLMDY